MFIKVGLINKCLTGIYLKHYGSFILMSVVKERINTFGFDGGFVAKFD